MSCCEIPLTVATNAVVIPLSYSATIQPPDDPPSGTLTIVANGQYNVIRYATANIDVSLVKIATGSFETSAYQQVFEIQHNLDSDKIIFVMQRVNEDHSLITVNDSPYYGVAYIWYSAGIGLDFEQTYQYGKNPAGVAFLESPALTPDYSEGYVYGTMIYFSPTVQAGQPYVCSSQAMNRAVNEIQIVDRNTIRCQSFYRLLQGRWVYTVYGLS